VFISCNYELQSELAASGAFRNAAFESKVYKYEDWYPKCD
jgi:hypothetical protein